MYLIVESSVCSSPLYFDAEESDACVEIVHLRSPQGQIVSAGYDAGGYEDNLHCEWSIEISGDKVRKKSMMALCMCMKGILFDLCYSRSDIKRFVSFLLGLTGKQAVHLKQVMK